MKILICNDDGVYAPGIKALRKSLSEIAEVIVVAPLDERSTTGHTLTLDHPLRLVKIEQNVFGCSGFPADCALMGIAHVLKSSRPDLIVSGINRGANLGQDTYYSGTVAAAREAAFHGIRSVAISSVVDFSRSTKPSHEYYETAAEFMKNFILSKTHEQIPQKTLLNINVPNTAREKIKGIKATEVGFRNYSEEILERDDFRGRKYFWIGGIYKGHDDIEGSDCNAIADDSISISPLFVGGSSKGREVPSLSSWQEVFDKIRF